MIIMLNQIVIVGRITKDVELVKEDGKSYTNMTLAVLRSYKNEEGIYETDFIPCVLWNGIAENVAEYCKKGDLVGVEGRIQSDEDGSIKVIAGKVTFLSTAKKEEE